MLDLQTLQRIRLTLRPKSQILIANTMLALNYGLLPGVGIALEGLENVPDEPVIFAMNHTDRFNYWPFQYQFYRQKDRFTATWVKGKYYENAAMGRFMEWTNNIPTVSRGYLITRDFISVLARKPKDAEYEVLRRWVDAVASEKAAAHVAATSDASAARASDDSPRGASDESAAQPPSDRVASVVEATSSAEALASVVELVPADLLTRPRSMLGRPFDPARETYADAIDALFRLMMARFVELNVERRAIGLDLLVFPQGTRSKRLSRGHVGLAQIALHLKQMIVPVGCSGSDGVYPSSSPWGRRGQIVYRIGRPLPYDDLSPFHVPPFQPFTAEAELEHRAAFQGLVDVVMQRIDELVDEPYRFAAELDSDGVRGSDRFV